MNKIVRGSCWFLAGVAALAGFGAIYQALADARDRRKYPPPGQRVDIGGRRLHLYCTGAGSPTVILEAGLNGCSIDWCLVQAQVAGFTRVCAYDRAGYGWSDSGPLPRTAPRMARELHTLLARAEIEPPYVLVGHSYGGELVRVYADRYPEDVAGMVLVDSSHEDQIERVGEIMLRKERMLDELRWLMFRLRPVLARLGILRLTKQADQGIEIYPLGLQPTAIALEEQSRAFDWTFGEAGAIPACNAYLRTAKPLREMPLVVISAGLPRNPDDPRQQVLRQVWTELQSELAKLSPRGKHIIAAETGHIVQLGQPELVVSAIHEVVEEVRRSNTSDWDYNRPWYHGSPQELTVLRMGSSISQDRDVARVFSHRPTLISMSDGGTLKHNGAGAGYLYVVAEEINPEDVAPHPHPVNVARWEWLTKRELRLTLIERALVRKEELLTEEEIAELRRKQDAAGAETFAE